MRQGLDAFSAAQQASRLSVSRTDGDYTETLTLYQGKPVIKSDLNSVPSACALVGIVDGNLHRNAKDAKDAATAVGIDASAVAWGYFPLSALPLLANRTVIIDADGFCWIIRDTPLPRKRFGVTNHIRCLLQQLNVRPDGVPSAS